MHYYNRVSEIIDIMQERLRLTVFNKDVLEIFCYFEGCDTLENWMAAEDSLNQLKELLRTNRSENSEIRNFFLLFLYLFLFYRSNNKEGMIKTEEEIYWKSCNCLTPLSLIGNILKNNILSMFFAQFLGLYFSHNEYFSIKDAHKLLNMDFKQRKHIEKFIKEFNKVLGNTAMETEGNLEGFESCKKPTLAYKLYIYLLKIYKENKSFQSDKYVSVMEFQFFRLFESGKTNPRLLEKLLTVFPLCQGNENSYLYVKMHILYICWEKSMEPSKKRRHFKKALNIFQSIRYNFDDKELRKERIDNLKRLKKSYKLFSKYETGEKKLMQMWEDCQKFERIIVHLEKKNKSIENSKLKKYLIKIKCPTICRCLIFCDLALEEDFDNIDCFFP